MSPSPVAPATPPVADGAAVSPEPVTLDALDKRLLDRKSVV